MELGLGLIGSGFMGRTHAFAFNNVARVFDLPVKVRPVMLADVGEEQAARAAAALGFTESTADWRRLVADPRVHIVSVTSPNLLHKEMALAAIAAGKHVYCEKPLAPKVSDAEEMVRAAEAKGVVTAVGFNYLKNPMMRLAKEIIDSGEIGEIRAFSGVHAEDFMMDAEVPWTWRLDPAGGGGALADLGSHLIAAARYLVGPVAEVCGEVATLVATRPDGAGSTNRKPVEVEDIGRAFLRFENGCSGVLEASWIAGGRKMRQDFEITGSRGSIAYCGERMNELDLYVASGKARRDGFRKILAGPANEPYGAFCVAPGHQLGFNDLKTIEVRDLVRAIAGEKTGHADFREGLEVQRTLEAIYRSTGGGGWTRVS
ncbi:Gfo/Idh/MocA family protein [Chelativorans xinjiangense]|uniref:Gfo/Idh/MocA family protein n=1 Tax=Chelativorans xinjiangense TaxID=2681485 RepID=UPI001357E12F|nr:Gfo/Idh/MocA family oxidoreductase [Chelativorans xinjiangense]